MTLISEAYREMQSDLHRQRPDYGVASVQFAPMVSELINTNNVCEVLDYGAGKGRLMQNLQVDHDLTVQMYDPAVPEYAMAPEPREMVCCIDVLEHIEPQYLDGVIEDLARLTKRIGFFTVATGPAQKTLPDGRNAHLIQQPPEWWLPKFLARFNLYYFCRTPGGFAIVVQARQQPEALAV